MAFASEQPIKEDQLTRSVESQTAKVPSIGYLGLAVGSMVVSAALAFIFKKRDLANFVGLWAPSILIMGLYNKVVKVEHEDLGHAENSSMNTSTSSSQYSV